MPHLPGGGMTQRPSSNRGVYLQAITIAWMLVELSVSIYAAATAHSPAMLAFGSDSLVEVLSAATVLSQWLPGIRLSERRAARINGGLLFALAAAVIGIVIASSVFHVEPETSRTGIAITAAALVAMPVLARLKRREASRTGDAAMAADAVQSATCAYIAGITLVGLALRAAFGIVWFDRIAALAAVPLLVKEGRESWRGKPCCCC
jgi:divalent metal cation (Fe/Co/Zn/Cd) transporter